MPYASDVYIVIKLKQFYRLNITINNKTIQPIQIQTKNIMFYATWCLLDCHFLLISRLWSVCFETDLFNFVLLFLLWMVCWLSSSTIFSCLNCQKIFLCAAYCNFIWPSFGVNASHISISISISVCMYKSVYFSHYFLMGKHTCTLIYVVVFSYEEVILINPDKH